MLWKEICSERPLDPDGAAGQLMEEIAGLLEIEMVEYAQVRETALFLLDLSKLGFKGMDLNVVILAHPARDEEEKKVHAELIRDYKHATESIGFCFYITLQMAPVEANDYIPSSLEAVNVTGADIKRLFESKAPRAGFFEIIRSQVQIQRLCPFNVSREARGAMFRGRRNELDRLVYDLDTHFLVTGARLIGKTSLLMKAYNVLRVRPEMRRRVYYFDCSTWGGYLDCAHRLAHSIEIRKEQRIALDERNIAYLLERRSAHGLHPLLLFFDEFDRVVDMDMGTGWPFMKLLHEAVSGKWVRLVFAGFRSMEHLYEKELGDKASPFHGALTLMTLDPLSQNETSGLLIDPFLGVDIHVKGQSEVTRRVYRNSKGYPFLVQYFGEKLFQKATSRDSREIDIQDVIDVEESFEIGDFLETLFLMNTIIGGVPATLERTCAFLFAHNGADSSWTKGDFLKACQENGHEYLDIYEIHDALKNLYNARVLSYEGRKFRFTFPLLRDILRDSYPDLDAVLNSMPKGLK